MKKIDFMLVMMLLGTLMFGYTLGSSIGSYRARRDQRELIAEIQAWQGRDLALYSTIKHIATLPPAVIATCLPKTPNTELPLSH